MKVDMNPSFRYVIIFSKKAIVSSGNSRRQPFGGQNGGFLRISF